MQKTDQHQNLESYSTSMLLRFIGTLLRPHQGKFWIATILRLAGDLIWLYYPIAFGFIVTFLTKYTPGTSLTPLWMTLLTIFFMTIFRNACVSAGKILGFQVGRRVGFDASLKTLQHMFRIDMAWHEKENTGNKLKRIDNGSDGIGTIFSLWFSSIIEITVNIIAINIIISQFDLTILVALLIFLVLYLFVSRALTGKAKDAARQVSIQAEEVNGLMFETVNNIRTVKLMSMTETIFKLLTDGINTLYKRFGRRFFLYQSRNGFLNALSDTVRLAIYVLIIKGILEGKYEVGFLVIFTSYFDSIRTSIDELATASLDFALAKINIGRMQHILEEPIKIDSDSGKVDFSPNWQEIKVKDVSFSYGDHKVLDNISFNIKRGEKIGIVGLSGAGKSTLFKLLLKEREEFEGDISFDTTSIKQIKKNDYFKQVSVVLQDTEVFNFSLKENISITNPGQTENKELLTQTLETAHITELVSKLPQGVDTLIGEKGVKLSGGERQRLGIARAIFKEPKLLLLDEATSHLDTESEEKIRDSLQKFLSNVTAIIIAHRLSTIKEMDKIIVMENGQIVEMGSFEELQTKKGRFFELWSKQKL